MENKLEELRELFKPVYYDKKRSFQPDYRYVMHTGMIGHQIKNRFTDNNNRKWFNKNRNENVVNHISHPSFDLYSINSKSIKTIPFDYKYFNDSVTVINSNLNEKEKLVLSYLFLCRSKLFNEDYFLLLHACSTGYESQACDMILNIEGGDSPWFLFNEENITEAFNQSISGGQLIKACKNLEEKGIILLNQNDSGTIISTINRNFLINKIGNGYIKLPKNRYGDHIINETKYRWRLRNIDKKFIKNMKAEMNHTCQHCGQTDNLELHHIIPVRYQPERIHDPENVILICEELHKEVAGNELEYFEYFDYLRNRSE